MPSPPIDRDRRLTETRLCASGGRGKNPQRRNTGRYVALWRTSVSLRSVLYPSGRDDAERLLFDNWILHESTWAIGTCWLSYIVSLRFIVRHPLKYRAGVASPPNVKPSISRIAFVRCTILHAFLRPVPPPLLQGHALGVGGDTGGGGGGGGGFDEGVGQVRPRRVLYGPERALRPYAIDDAWAAALLRVRRSFPIKTSFS